MRTIKFRAWDNISKKMYNFVQLTSYKDGSLGVEIGNSYSDLFIPKDAILLEFTGFQDGEGSEIYDGLDENDYVMNWFEFWKYRTNPNFDSGWKLF